MNHSKVIILIGWGWEQIRRRLAPDLEATGRQLGKDIKGKENMVVQIACEGWCMSKVQRHVSSILRAYYEHVDKERMGEEESTLFKMVMSIRCKVAKGRIGLLH